MSPRPSPRLLGVLCLLGAILFAADIAADTPIPVEVTLLGPGDVRLRLAVGYVLPCDSPDDSRIVEGKFPAGAVIRALTPEACVCVQHTFQPFPDVDWSEPEIACRPVVCTGHGRGRRCVPAPDPTIRLRIPAKRSQ